MKTCITSCSPVFLLFFVTLIMQYGVDVQGCCFSLNYDIIPGGQYSVNVTATDPNVSDEQYKALVQFPSGYTVNPSPTSPFTTLSCTQEAGTSFECNTQNYPEFFANFILSLPPVPPNSSPQNVSAQVTILGNTCKQQDFCSTLVLPASSDKISLGFLGVWPKYVAIIVGVVLGLLLLAILFYIWRRYNPSDKYLDRSEVTDILRDKDPNSRAPSTVLLGTAAPGRSMKKPPPAAKKRDRTRRDSKSDNMVAEVYSEKLASQELGTGLSNSLFLPMTSVVVDIENDTVSEVEIEEEAASRGRSHDIKMLTDTGVVRKISVPEEKERERREHREQERERGRHDDMGRERRRDSKNLMRSATTSGTKTHENEKYVRERESRSHRHSMHAPKERSKSRDATVSHNERDSRRTSRRHRSRSKPRDSDVLTNDPPLEIPLPRPKSTSGELAHNPSTRNKSRTGKEKNHDDDLRRRTIRTSTTEIDIAAESGMASVPESQRRKSMVLKGSQSEKNRSNRNGSGSRPTTMISISSKSSSKRPKKQETKRSKDDDSDNESSSSENLPLGDRLPLAMIASTAISPITTTSTKKESKDNRKPSSSSISKSSKLTTSKSLLKKQSPEFRGEDGEGSGYYENILDDVLDAGDPGASESNTGSAKVRRIDKRAQQTPHGGSEKRKSRLGVAISRNSEDDEVPIGRLKSVHK